MKKMICPVALAIIVVITTNVGCHKSSANKNCGCDSPTIQTVDSISGTLYFDSSLKKYYITSGTPGLQTRFTICDTSFSPLQAIVRTPPDHISSSYWIIFSGDVKKFCIPDSIVGYFDFMNNIQLAKIKKQ
ncbi:MAG: hypothetical protein JST10_09105 [Bacteroidetes bacterium]|nr:hypothetical protein [Bacteroidota bacterium]MBS1632717.1 hypothetical protein [Bacteroidota bacterium]